MPVVANQLVVAEGAFRILEDRVTQAGQPGLTLWTSAGQMALREYQARRAAAQAAFDDAVAALDVPPGATRADLFRAIERANRRLKGLIETTGLACLTVLLCSAALGDGDDDDDLARRGPRGRTGRRRRDDMIEICDGETGTPDDSDLESAGFFSAVGSAFPEAEVSSTTEGRA
jgi:hypothetical protein